MIHMNNIIDAISKYATGYTNAMGERVSNVETTDRTISIRFLINANQAQYEMDMIKVYANATYNANTNKTTVMTENGKGSRKYNTYVKNAAEQLMNLFIKEVKKDIEVEIKEANSKAYDQCHIELLGMIDKTSDSKKNVCFEYINQIMDMYVAGASAEEMFNKKEELKEEMFKDVRLFDNNIDKNKCKNEIETIENNNTITTEAEQVKTFKKPYATYDNGVWKGGIGKNFDLVYILETTKEDPETEEINFSNIHKVEFNDIQSAFNMINRYQELGYHNIQFWTEVRYKGETIIENGSENGVEFLVNESRLKEAKAIKKENDKLKQDVKQYQSFMEQYKATKTFEDYLKNQENINKDQNNLYWYEMTLRPLSPFCQPKDHFKYDESKGRNGIVAYKRPLTHSELEEYELKKWNVAN